MGNPSKYFQQTIQVTTAGRGCVELTSEIKDIVSSSCIEQGLCHIFIHHTSASLMLCENADPDVRADLETFMSHIVPDGDAMFIHRDEGDDDMPAHIRSILTHSELTLPVSDARLGLGTWQGVYLWEHRYQPHKRNLTLTVHGSL